MKALGKFILLDLNEFEGWLNMQLVTRKISLIQQHHTYVPAYRHFKNENHFELCKSMEKDHLERGFAEISQNFTTLGTHNGGVKTKHKWLTNMVSADRHLINYYRKSISNLTVSDFSKGPDEYI